MENSRNSSSLLILLLLFLFTSCESQNDKNSIWIYSTLHFTKVPILGLQKSKIKHPYECIAFKKLDYTEDQYAIVNTCNIPLNIGHCSRMVMTDFFGLITQQEPKYSCKNKKVEPSKWVDSFILAGENSSIFKKALSEYDHQFQVCDAPFWPIKYNNEKNKYTCRNVSQKK